MRVEVIPRTACAGALTAREFLASADTQLGLEESMVIRRPSIEKQSLSRGRKRPRRSVRAALGLPPVPKQSKRGPRPEKTWRHGKRGVWKYTESVQVVEHKCSTCKRTKYRYQYSCFKFWRMTPNGPQVLTQVKKGEPGVKLPIADPCLCLGAGRRLTPRLIRLMAARDSRVMIIPSCD